MTHDIFISYSNKDKAVADAVLTAFETSGLRCWMAPRDIKPGADWGDSIIEAINRCKIVLLVFSGNSNQSKHVRDEVYYAISQEKIILPFRIENLDPTGALRLHLSSLHWLDAYQPSWQAHIDRLINSAADSLGYTPIPPVQREEPMAPAAAPVISPAKKEIKKIPWLWIGLAVVVTAGLSIGGMLLLGGGKDQEGVQPAVMSASPPPSTDVPTEMVVQPTSIVPEGAVFNPRNGHAYLFVPKEKSWHDARDYCAELDGYLATVQDAVENIFIYSLMNGSAWLGATDEVEEGTWVWVSGEPFDHTNWAGFPDNADNHEHYIEFLLETPYLWNDAPDKNLPFVCEWEPADPASAWGNVIVVTSNADSGEGTLRQALLDAQAGDTITFDPSVFPLEGEDAIFLQSGLPAIHQGFLTLDASKTRVALEGSQISGGWTPGLEIQSDYNVIQGFAIGGFSGPGILLGANSQYNLVGGDRTSGPTLWGEGNLILHNSDGIAIMDASNNIIAGNSIGTTGTDTGNLGNRSAGIFLEGSSSGNLIGPDNLIAFNGTEGGAGIEIRSLEAKGNIITANTIHDNQWVGIGYNIEGFSPSQVDYLALPDIQYFDLDAGFIYGRACGGCIVELFSTEMEDGKWYEGTAITDESGNFYFDLGRPVDGPYLTATSRLPGENTSEFSMATPAHSEIKVALDVIRNEAPLLETSFDTWDFGSLEGNARLEAGKLIIESASGAILQFPDSDRFAIEFEFRFWDAGPEGHCNISLENGFDGEANRWIVNGFFNDGNVNLARSVYPNSQEDLAFTTYDISRSNTIMLIILGDQIAGFINGKIVYVALNPNGNVMYAYTSFQTHPTIVCEFDNYKFWDLSAVQFNP